MQLVSKRRSFQFGGRTAVAASELAEVKQPTMASKSRCDASQVVKSVERPSGRRVKGGTANRVRAWQWLSRQLLLYFLPPPCATGAPNHRDPRLGRGSRHRGMTILLRLDFFFGLS
jgi:hypothetical protein